MFLLKNDGRRQGKYHLEEDGSFIGANFSLTEFQAALLCEGMERLPKENAQREQTAEYLTNLLETIPGIISIKPYSKNNRRAYFHYNIRYDPEYFNGKYADVIAEALSAELGFWVRTSHSPLNNCRLFQPSKDNKFKHLALPDYSKCNLIESKKQNQTTILFHHPILLSGKNGADKIFEAFAKINSLSHQLH
jgi:L-glutamine:2-deoxy-scyllo-inosose/3-amino-2,3-dideoxy-scyllo-inosose aminotransferase